MAGSSPRVRGTLLRLGSPEVVSRFIPACAGNIVTLAVDASISAVHPRVCGEHLLVGVSVDAAYGSSPRVRGTSLGWIQISPAARFIPACAGTYAARHFCHGIPRFIPACAGNMCSVWRTQPSCPVHPRVCGEHDEHTGETNFLSGSSPRVRGTSPWFFPPPCPCRFIPACAGNISQRPP